MKESDYKILDSFRRDTFTTDMIDEFLEGDYIIKDKITFDDHHQYRLDDIECIDGNIVTTEKDAVKLALLNKNNIYALKLKTTLPIETIELK